MNQPDKKTARATKALLTKFRRRRLTVYHKLASIHEDCGADISLTVRYRGKFYCFRASSDETFPPPPSEIKMTYPVPELHSPISLKPRSQKAKVIE
ncbi:hypothetical protein SPBR_09227 [Sporothrix brasiliensis 5110]|uniref:MADS-box domain-containing protein n=1 Tax=Sporothrix brasiliensis 5110 TaxID=1398154 RepID=A0A0C2FTA2_9PEZI|nr:uncharacterized protein SPBR_09227 [Sporothrix brasiliensis 5110]KIH94243.1 hypothetical protein SPBR_09227 [Sporothrix brasiliensis 5110]